MFFFLPKKLETKNLFPFFFPRFRERNGFSEKKLNSSHHRNKMRTFENSSHSTEIDPLPTNKIISCHPRFSVELKQHLILERELNLDKDQHTHSPCIAQWCVTCSVNGSCPKWTDERVKCCNAKTKTLSAHTCGIPRGYVSPIEIVK